MKFLIIGDLHGRKPKIYYKKFDAIIAPGDFCSDKGIRPLKDAWMKALEKKETDSGLDEFIIKKIGKSRYKKLEKESLKVGRKILEFLDSFNKPVFIVPGNWDQSYGTTKIKNINKNDYLYYKGFLDFWLGKRTNKFLVQGLKNIYDCQYQLFIFPEFNIIGYGLSSAPEYTKQRAKKFTVLQRRKYKKAYLRILQRLDLLYSKRDRNKPTIFLTHNVPYGTTLDQLINKKSSLHKKHFGSVVALKFCKKYKPLVCIGGHMHEHFRSCKIGATTAINAGFGSFVNVWMELSGSRIKKLEFYRGRK